MLYLNCRWLQLLCYLMFSLVSATYFYEACQLDASGCKWLAPPCISTSRSIPHAEFVKVAPDTTTFGSFDEVLDLKLGIRFTGGELYGGSIVTPAPILCAFPNTYDGKPNSWVLAGRDSSGPPGTGSFFKMVEVELDSTSIGITTVNMSSTRAGFLEQDNNQCSSANDLMDAWRNRDRINVTACGIPGSQFPECDGYGLIGVEISVVTTGSSVPWQTFDLSTVAEPPGREYAAPGKIENQTFYYNFCRGTTSHGNNGTSFDYACRGGVSAVCQTTEETVRDGLAYPCGTVQNVVARTQQRAPDDVIGVKLEYSNPRDYNNNRNTQVILQCDEYATTPVFYPVAENASGGPMYTMIVKTKAGCTVPYTP